MTFGQRKASDIWAKIELAQDAKFAAMALKKDKNSTFANLNKLEVQKQILEDKWLNASGDDSKKLVKEMNEHIAKIAEMKEMLIKKMLASGFGDESFVDVSKTHKTQTLPGAKRIIPDPDKFMEVHMQHTQSLDWMDDIFTGSRDHTHPRDFKSGTSMNAQPSHMPSPSGKPSWHCDRTIAL